MDEEIDLAPFVLDGVERGIHRRIIGDVGGDHRVHADGFDQRAHAALQTVALIGERDLGALGSQLARNAPGDGVLVGDAHHDAALAFHQVACRRCPVISHVGKPLFVNICLVNR